MGLNEGGCAKTYLKISQGRIAKRVDESDDKAIRCTNKDGTKTWYERRWPSVSGLIKNVWKRDTEWGPDLCIEIEDSHTRFELQMPLNSKYAKGFLVCMPNIDVSKEITFTPWMKEVQQDGKSIKKTALYLSYGPAKEDQIEWFWTREKNNGLPEMKQLIVKGKPVWDDTEQMAYLMDHLNNTFLARLGKQMREESSSMDAGTLPVSEPEPNERDESDDLQF